jgi:hypothetical protein
MAERQEGLREGSVISRESLAAAEDGDEDVWLNIKRELEDYGTITEAVLNEQRDFIIDLLKSGLSKDDADQGSEIEQCQSNCQISNQTGSEIIAAMKVLALSEQKCQSDFRSIQGVDDDISEYLMDDLHDALSFYEMFCQEPSEKSNETQINFGLKLHLLGRRIKVLQRLTSANPEFWHRALSNTIDVAEEVIVSTEPMVEHWLSPKISEGLWEPGATRLSRLETSSSKEVLEPEDYGVEKDILVLKDNLQVIRTAVQVENSPIPLRRIMHQQIGACQFSLLVFQWYSPPRRSIKPQYLTIHSGAIWSYAHLKHYENASSYADAEAHVIRERHLRRRSDMLIMRTNLLQALLTCLSRLATPSTFTN